MKCIIIQLREKPLLILFFLYLAMSSVKVFAFNYNQKLIVHDDTFIAQLNNCGVHQTAGRYIRGNSRVATIVNQKEVLYFTNLEDGVASILVGGDIYFSPNGKHLDGGGSSYKIGNVPGSIQNLVGHRQNLIAHTKIGSTNYIYLFENAKSSARIQTSFATSAFSIVGVVGDYLYIQLPDASVRFTYYSQELRSPTVLSRANANGSGQVRQIIQYRRGAAVLSDSGIYYSTDKAQLTSGPAVKILQTNTSHVRQIANKDGTSADETYTVTVDVYEGTGFVGRQNEVTTIAVDGTRGLYTALNNGNTYYSPSGNNLLGGGGSTLVTRGITPEMIRDHLKTYKEQLGDAAPDNIDEIRSWVLSDGESVELGQGSNILLKDLRFAGWMQDFAGYPATLRLYDKGWDNWEYKWRDMGLQTGTMDVKTNGSEIFDLGIKAKAVGGCAIVAAIKFTTPADLKLSASYNPDNGNSSVQFSADEINISTKYGNNGALQSIGYGGEWGSINYGIDNFSWGGIYVDGYTVNFHNIFNIEDCPSIANRLTFTNNSLNMSWFEFFSWGFKEYLYYHFDSNRAEGETRSIQNRNLCSIDFE